MNGSNVMNFESLDMNWDSMFGKSEEKKVNEATDALICSLNDLGCIDLEYMESISQIPMNVLLFELSDYIYQDPASWDECWYKGYKTKEEYLSGDIFTKIQIAEDANLKYDGYFVKNVEALKEVLPKGVSYDEIYYSIGSSWIDKEIIKDFIVDIFKTSISRKAVEYIKETDSWIIKDSVTFYDSANYTFGTSRIGTKALLLKILNHQEITVSDIITVDGKEKRVLNKDETVLALEKAEILELAFKSYIDRNNLEDKIIQCYNEKFRYIVNRKYDGSFLKLPNLYGYQKDAVARILFNKNTLLAHNVGAGKTYIMITAGEELLRLGYSKKNLYIVPNNIVGQWEQMYKSLYPNRELLVIYPKDFNPRTKDELLKEMQCDETKVVITAFSVFDRFKHDVEFEIEQIKNKLKELDNVDVASYYVYHHVDVRKRALERKLRQLESLDKNDEITFENLGFTRLFVDEAHNYKNIDVTCKKSRLNGVSVNGSEKCNNLLMATDYLNSIDAGIIMATGTPITNSVADIYIFQRYLQNSQLKLLDIDTFDKWLSVFTEVTDEIEVDVDTTKYRSKSRINKFYNIDDLTNVLSNVADFCNPNGNKRLPSFKGYTDIVVKNNPEFKTFLTNISERVELIRNQLVPKDQDNLLKVTIDGRLAALDLRLVKDIPLMIYDNKVGRCAEEVYKVYRMYPNTTQVVFCDSSVPKEGFNVYDELKSELIKYNIKSEEIEFIHNGSTEAKKAKILNNVRTGKIRIIIGSTSKLGTGVNIQDKLKAIHHLDVPWRPSDMMQREGRILREGNTNDEILMYRYIQESSFDAYSWHILERKAKVIREMLASTLTDKETEDIENTVLSYAEIKALAVGNEKMKTHIELCNKRSRLFTLAKKQNERYETLYNEIDVLSGRIKNNITIIERMNSDLDDIGDNLNLILRDINKNIKKVSNVKRYYDNVEEIVLFETHGFKIVLPKFFGTKVKHYSIVNHMTYNIRYKGEKDLNAARIYDVIATIKYKIINYEHANENMERSKETILGELQNKISFEKELSILNEQINAIEKELGINE